MQINFKHVAATAMAVAMSLSLAVPAFAEGPAVPPTPVTKGNLTVTGHELTGKNVFAVRMFKATATKNSDDSGSDYDYASYELEDKWLPFFKAEKYPGVTTSEYLTAGITLPGSANNEDYKEAALKYLEWLATNEDNDEKDWADFAEEAQDWLYAQSPSVFTVTDNEGVKTVTIDKAWNVNKLASCVTATAVDKPTDNLPTGTATFTDLPTGYYVVYPEGGSTGNDIEKVEGQPARGTDAMLINIPTDEQGATWNIKSTYPTVDKEVDTDNDNQNATDNGSAQVGDTVTFTLTSKVPDMSDYTAFYFAFNDTLSKGLEFVEKTPGDSAVDAKDVTVTIDGKTVTAGYTVSLSGKDLKIEFTDLKKGVTVTGGTVTTGAEIVVAYQAKITEDAVSDSGSIVGNAQNDVYLEYSNNPSTTDKGTSTPDTSKVYTYDIDVDKWASDMAATNLAGAQFQLTTDKAGDNVVRLIATDKTTGGDATDLNNAYRVAKPGEEGVETFTTDDDGKITIAGLKAGTYYLHEVAAPTGYNKLKDPVEIEIIVDAETAATYAPDGNEDKYNNVSFENPLYVVNGTANANANDATIKVENKKGIELPETGSIGTIGLTIAGVAIVLIGVFAPRKKKNNQE